MPEFIFHMEMDVRGHGDVRAAGDTVEAAIAQLSPAYVARNIDTAAVDWDRPSHMTIVDVTEVGQAEPLAVYRNHPLEPWTPSQAQAAVDMLRQMARLTTPMNGLTPAQIALYRNDRSIDELRAESRTLHDLILRARATIGD